MKPAIEKPTADNSHNPAQAPSIPSWRKPQQMIPVTPSRTPVRNPPTLETLANLAATMATPTEKPAATARRAMELFAACERELVEREKIATQESARIQRMCDVAKYEQAFLSHFKSGKNLWFDSFGPHERAKLEDFLKACTPIPRGRRLMDKFQDFVASEIFRRGGIIGIPTRTASEAASIAPLVVKRFSDEGFPINTNLCGIRDAFLDFLEDDSKNQKSNRAARSKRMKPIHQAARKLHKGMPLTADDKSLLNSMTPEESESVVDKLGLRPADVDKWKAAIEDLKTPERARPRVRRI